MFLPINVLTAQAALTLLVTITSAQYSIQDDYSPSNFASMFDFFTDADPTSGYVNYVSQSQAESEGLYSAGNNTVHIGVDSKNVATGRGRDSVRLSSKKSYNHGLIVLDLEHMPGGQCGTWPAFWTLGPNWPNSGEIDIIENVNTATTNQMTAHTNTGCSITNTGKFAGTLDTANCDINAANQAQNQGCTITNRNTQTYGSGFNAAGGGVYATEWTSQAISIWFFSRSAIPSDITSGTPNPANWGMPLAQFTGGCDIDKHFVNQQIVFDMTFCGQWAGQVWSSDAACAPLASTCQDYVQNHPSAFVDTYWTINSLKVYQANGQAQPSPTASTTTASVIPTTSSIATTFSTASIPYTAPGAPTTTSTYVPPTNAPSTYTQTTYTNTWSTNTWATNTWTKTWPSEANTWTAPPAASATGSWSGWNGGQTGAPDGQGSSGWGHGGESGWGGWGGWGGHGGRGGPPK